MRVLNDTPTRTGRQVLDELEELLKSVGDDAPILEVVLATSDFLLMRGLAGAPGFNLIRDYPAATKALKMHVTLPLGYNGPPRIVRPVGTEAFDANVEAERRNALLKRHQWRETDDRLRRGVDGRRL